MIVPVILAVLVMNSTYELFSDDVASREFNVTLSTYKESSVYYRIGDNSLKNLGPKFIDISKKNQAIVNVASPKSYIINGKIRLIYFIFHKLNKYCY